MAESGGLKCVVFRAEQALVPQCRLQNMRGEVSSSVLLRDGVAWARVGSEANVLNIS